MIPLDTIVATATPHGFGGVSVVRMSGPDSKNIIRSISLSSKKKEPFKHKTVVLVRLIDENNVPFEDGVVTFFKKPNSYTGEDVVEISCHGNPSIVNKLILICCVNGARTAEPGEFTKRAFLNGKIDLIQAEAVASLIQSKTDESASLSFKMLHGELSTLMKKIKKSLIGLLAKIEFELDVSEGDLQPKLLGDALLALGGFRAIIEKALVGHNSVRMLNEGANVVICGAPNVGKSTLLNSIAGFNRAITGPQPGTTRDVIETSVSIGGVPVTLIDTAGLRVSKNKIEKEGVLRAEREISNADCVVVVTPANGKINIGDLSVFGGPLVHVISKADLCKKQEIESLKKQFPESCIVSAKASFGVKKLLKIIQVCISISPSLGDLVPVVTSRQNIILKKILYCIQNAGDLLSGSGPVPFDLVSFELRDALNQLDLVLGKTVTDDILDSVFSDFCVGK